MRRFESSVWLPKPQVEIFHFFSSAENLNRITPPWLHFRILTRLPVKMEKGTLLDYTLRIHGIPVKWQTEILEWEPPHRFRDRQNRGPYKKWIHTHEFEPQKEGTRCRDIVEYEIPGLFLEPWIAKFLVLPDIEKIFSYRSAALQNLFPAE